MPKKTAISTLVLMLAAAFLFSGVNLGSVVAAETKLYGGRLVACFLANVRSKCTAHEDWQYTEIGCILYQLIYDIGWTYFEVEDSTAIANPPVPQFFIDWEVSEDGKVWTVHIPSNATFHDGTPVTAEDVKFTADYYCQLPYCQNMIIRSTGDTFTLLLMAYVCTQLIWRQESGNPQQTTMSLC
ncbi:MAG: ABC transporter substrate-binding protein [Candidatus Bathyarchaeia archaeon]